MTAPDTTGANRPDEELQRFLEALYGRARPGLLVELRIKTGGGMTQRFLPVDRLDEVRKALLQLAAGTDIYVGVLPRWRARGARRDVAGGAQVVWADCDGEEAVRSLAEFAPPPSVVVRSGSGDNRHAYWLLESRAKVADVQRANRRLALALGSDAGSAEAARILRPPSTLNHKHAPPTSVRLEACATDRRYALHMLVGGLPEAPGEFGRPARRSTGRGDALRAVAPELYVQRLTGQVVGRSRKVRCPLHDDRVPSLHVYPQPERGWYCFGCRRGGSVYDLAALLWFSGQSSGAGGPPLRGAQFIEVRERLVAMFFGEGKAA